jgi:hypothetical protein
VRETQRETVMTKVANRDVRAFGWGIAHGAVTRRPPISFYAMVPRTGGCAYGVGVWDFSLVQGPFSARRACSDLLPATRRWS